MEEQLTVIIPTWDQGELLRLCLASLRKQTVPSKILVVDNGSTDATQAIIESERATFPGALELIALDRNFGFARAVNEGIKASTGPYLALLNNDTQVDPHWVEAGIRAFREFPEWSFFASRVISFHSRHNLDSAGDCYDRWGFPHKRGRGRSVESFTRPEPVLGASASAAFYRRELFEDVGLFDEEYFMYLEDVDLSLRAQLKGHRCLYLPEAVVYHIEAASDPRYSRAQGPGVFYSPDRVYWITRNQWQLMLTYQPLRHLPWLVSGWIRSTGVHLIKRREGRAFLRGLAGGIGQSHKALRKRLLLKRKRRISPPEFRRLLNRC